MTGLDQALVKFIQDEDAQDAYYGEVLDTLFYLPTRDDPATAPAGAPLVPEERISPLLLEADGKTYMLLFDSEERLAAWAKSPVSYVALPGRAVARITPPGLHWAVNVGTGFAKEFLPDEIAWLQGAGA